MASVFSTLAEKESELVALRAEMQACSERLRYLGSVETSLQQDIFALKQQVVLMFHGLRHSGDHGCQN